MENDIVVTVLALAWDLFLDNSMLILTFLLSYFSSLSHFALGLHSQQMGRSSVMICLYPYLALAAICGTGTPASSLSEKKVHRGTEDSSRQQQHVSGLQGATHFIFLCFTTIRASKNNLNCVPIPRPQSYDFLVFSQMRRCLNLFMTLRQYERWSYALTLS